MVRATWPRWLRSSKTRSGCSASAAASTALGCQPPNPPFTSSGGFGAFRARLSDPNPPLDYSGGARPAAPVDSGRPDSHAESMDEVNPALPFIAELAFSVLPALAAALWVFGLVTLWRARARLAPAELMLWVAVILLVPIVGAAAWLFCGCFRAGVR